MTTTDRDAEIAALRDELAALTAAAEPVRNFPDATPAELANGLAIITRAAERAGYPGSTADDMAANGMFRILRRPWHSMPNDIRHAAHAVVKQARRCGWQSLMNPSDRPRGRKADQTAAAREAATMAIVRRRSATLTPADTVAWAETRRVRVAVALEAQGWTGDDPTDAARWTAAVPSSRPPHRIPSQGCPGLHTDTDPVPGSHARAAGDTAAEEAEVRRRLATLAG